MVLAQAELRVRNEFEGPCVLYRNKYCPQTLKQLL